MCKRNNILRTDAQTAKIFKNNEDQPVTIHKYRLCKWLVFGLKVNDQLVAPATRFLRPKKLNLVAQLRLEMNNNVWLEITTL